MNFPFFSPRSQDNNPNMLVALFVGVGALQAPLRAPQSTTARSAVSAPIDVSTLSRRDLVGALVGAAGAATVLSAPGAAFAESTLVTRQQAYTRYVPRIERGRDYWSNAVRKAVASSDWATISAACEPKGSIDRIFGPMELWASSWSGKSISDKTTAMADAVNELRDATNSLKIAAEGKEGGGGFFGFGGAKVMDPAKRGDLATAAYKKGVIAINKYIEIGNDGIGLQVSLGWHTARQPAPCLARPLPQAGQSQGQSRGANRLIWAV